MQTSDVLLGKIARDLNCLFDPHRGIRRRSIQKLKRILTTEPRSEKVTRYSSGMNSRFIILRHRDKFCLENNSVLQSGPTVQA